MCRERPIAPIAFRWWSGSAPPGWRSILSGRPIPLCFEAEHPVGELPSVPELTADEAAGRVVTAFRSGNDREAVIAEDGPAFAARCATRVETDIKAAPIMGGRQGRCLCVDLCRKVSRISGASTEKGRSPKRCNRRISGPQSGTLLA